MDQRREPRRDYLGKVIVKYTRDSGEDVSMQGMIQDRSRSGFGIEVLHQILPGTEIRLVQGETVFQAIVRRCVKLQFGFHLGVELKSGD